MRISIVLPGFPKYPTGGYAIAYKYANALASAGHSVIVEHWRLPRASDVRKSLAQRSLTNAAYRVAPTKRPSWVELDARVRVRNSAGNRAPALSADVVVATSAETAPWVANLVRGSDTLGVYLIQHWENWSISDEEVEATWRLPLFRVAVSGWLQQIAHEMGLDAALVQNGIDRSLFAPGPVITNRPLQVLAMVSEVPWKRADLVCRIFDHLSSRMPNAQLVAFGTGDRPGGLPPSVRYVRNPAPDALVHLYQQSRVYVCASDAEGFGLPVAEAMACGTPVVSTAIGGVQSFAGDSVTYGDPGDWLALAKGALALLENVSAATAASSAGLRAAEGLDHERSASTFVRVLEAAFLSRQTPGGA